MYTVIIADDEKAERELIYFLLTKNFPDKFHILDAVNGKEALSLIQDTHPEILLTDIEMPFLNGIELAQQARVLSPDMEILFFSGYDDFEYVQSALFLQAVNYILKPVNEDDFRNSIECIIKRLDSVKIPFARSSHYIERSFHDTAAHDTSDDTESSLEDHILLKQIEAAIDLKQSEQLTQLVHTLLNKYSSSNERSHIYIRHIASTLLYSIMHSTRDLTERDFEKAAEEIFTFRRFSDIEKTVYRYLDLLTLQIRQEMETPNYAVHLIKQYIEDHYGEDLSLNILADQVYLNPNYLSNIFTKVTGDNITKYIKKVRMQKARHYLVNTNIKISEIGKMVGYPNTSYFIRTFQDTFGVTPERYRNDYPS